MNELID